MRIFKRKRRFVVTQHDESDLKDAIEDRIDNLDSQYPNDKIRDLTSIVGILANALLRHNLLTHEEVTDILPYNFKIGVEGLDYE